MSFVADQLVEEHLKNGTNPNLAKTEEYVMNPRGQIIHCRSHLLPDKVKMKGVVIYIHGYCGHGSRATQHYIAKQLNDSGFGYLTLDLHGHGYSDGVRALVEDPWDLCDDLLSCCISLFSEDDKIVGGGGSADGSRNPLVYQNSILHLKSDVLDNPDTPFYFLGHSMGGATATLAALCLTASKSSFSLSQASEYARQNKVNLETISMRFNGVILLAPLIEIFAPMAAKPVVNLFACCCPEAEIPRLFTGGPDESKVWTGKEYITYCRNDSWPENPSGLTYGGSPRLRTLVTLMDISELMLEVWKYVSFPFLIMHDPEDKITKWSGSVKAKKLAVSSDGQIMDVPGGLHDLLTNDLKFCMKQIISWFNDRI
jgi:acylglycerol lipase